MLCAEFGMLCDLAVWRVWPAVRPSWKLSLACCVTCDLAGE